MSSLYRTFGSAIPVVAQSNNSATRQREAADPDVGMRWGARAAFDFTAPTIDSDGAAQSGIWVEIDESDEFPPKRRRDIACGLQVSRQMAHVGRMCFAITWGAKSGFKNYYYVPYHWSFEWREPLPKKHIGQLGQGVRHWKFNMSGAAGVFE